MGRNKFLAVLFILICCAGAHCGRNPAQDAASDSGPPPTSSDAGVASDSGDGSGPDAGEPTDAGPGLDAGPSGDGGLFNAVPLIDMGSQTYQGFTGGLYPNASNVIPSAHAAIGKQRALAIQPLDVNGNPSPSGKVVMISIGMSNVTDEFCAQASTTTVNPVCTPNSFMGQTADAGINPADLVIVDGAMSSEDAKNWITPDAGDYDSLLTNRLTPKGVTEQQVQVAWVKEADGNAKNPLPAPQADAYLLESYLGDIVRAMQVRYPNLKQVFISSRIYAGYALSTLNPEPYAYESGFAVKWLIQAQIDQMSNGGTVVDTTAGDLNYNTVAPWITWGPYLWADGMNPRSDGLIWRPTDFQPDGTHPSPAGIQKVGSMLLKFFSSSDQTRCWFVDGGTCP